MRSMLFVLTLILVSGCSTMDTDVFRRATREATLLASIDPAAPVAGLPVADVHSLRTEERVIVYYTDSTLRSAEGGLYLLNNRLPPCDAPCKDTIARVIQAKLDQHSPVRFWRGTTLSQVRASHLDDLQIILETRNRNRYSIPLWRIEAMYSYERNPELAMYGDLQYYTSPWWLVLILGICLGAAAIPFAVLLYVASEGK